MPLIGKILLGKKKNPIGCVAIDWQIGSIAEERADAQKGNYVKIYYVVAIVVCHYLMIEFDMHDHNKNSLTHNRY